jgi:hypothetical protein
LFHDRQDRDVSDGDGIEQVEVMDYVEGASVMFDNTEPSGAVSGIGWFIQTRHYFVMDNLDELVMETRQDGDVLVDPQHMWNCWDVDQREEIIISCPPALRPNDVPASPLLATGICQG